MCDLVPGRNDPSLDQSQAEVTVHIAEEQSLKKFFPTVIFPTRIVRYGGRPWLCVGMAIGIAPIDVA